MNTPTFLRFKRLSAFILPCTALWLACLLPWTAQSQSIVLPGQDGVIFQRCGAGQGAQLDLAIDFSDAGLTQVQVQVEKFNSYSATSPGPFIGWTDYNCTQYPGAGSNIKMVSINLGGGLYRITIRRKDNTSVVAPGKIMGVGEVFYVAGQSNTTGKGDVPTPALDGTVSKYWRYFENIKDFTPASVDPSQLTTACHPAPGYPSSFPKDADGSDPGKTYVAHWDYFMQEMVKAWGVPIAVYQAGWAGTKVSEWARGSFGLKACRLAQNFVAGGPGTYPYYNLTRLFNERKLNGIRAVLWHQGEFDALVNTSGTSYRDSLQYLISNFRSQIKTAMGVTTNVPWVVAKASWQNGQTNSTLTAQQVTVAGQANNWSGPDTDLIGSADRDPDNTHFNTNGLKKIADAWKDKLVNTNFLSQSVPVPGFQHAVCCTPPAAPTISPQSVTITAGQSVTLNASGCPGGVISWKYGQTGTQITVSPSLTDTYWAKCTVGGCASQLSAEATVTVNQPPASCYTLDHAGIYYDGNPSTPNKRMTRTLSNGVYKVNLQAESSDPSQVWRIDDVGGYKKISRPTNTSQVLGVVNDGNSQNNEITLVTYTGNDSQLWTQDNSGSITTNCSGCYAFFRKNSSYAMGSIKGPWGTGSGSSAENDYGLVPGSDASTYGFAKLVLKPATCPTTGIREAAGEIQMREDHPLVVSPNPNEGRFSVTFALASGQQAQLTVTDMQGRSWYEKSVRTPGQHREEIDLRKKVAGTVLVTLRTGGQVQSRKVLIRSNE